MGSNLIKIIGLCQVNDIIPIIFSANNISECIHGNEKINSFFNADEDTINVPSVGNMQKLIQNRGPRKRSYNINNIKKYLLFSSLYNRGMGCAGTSPMIKPFMVCFADEDGRRTGGIFQNLTVAYNKLRKLVRDYFKGEKDIEPLIVITPDLNRKILRRQLSPKRIGLNIKIEEIAKTDSEECYTKC
jgi:hypothetical protein